MKALFVLLAVLAANQPKQPAKGKSTQDSTCRPSGITYPLCDGATGYYPWNGAYLEGPGLETLHFAAASGGSIAFPPPVGAVLNAVSACGHPSPISVSVTSCDGTTGGTPSCTVHVQSGPQVCANAAKPSGTKDPQVMFVRGYWDGQGKWISDPSAVTLACNVPEVGAPQGTVNSAIGTCINGQYTPTANPDLFLACIRAIRGDYCGDGVPHTELRTPIAIHDRTFNVMSSGQCGDTFDFEATWSPDGAVCVVHDRWTGLGMSDASCLKALHATKCSEDVPNALIFTRSHCNLCPLYKGPVVSCSPDQDPVCTSAQKHLRGE
jgi:hypothetical protein